MTTVTKRLAVVAVLLITLGAILLSLGAIGFRATDEPDANIGAGFALLAGPYVVRLGLVFALSARLPHLTPRRRWRPTARRGAASGGGAGSRARSRGASRARPALPTDPRIASPARH